MKTSNEWSDFGAIILFFGIIFLAIVSAYEFGKHSTPKYELSLLERRNIAIQFMCFDYRKQWSGARSFCGSIGPMDSKGMVK